MVDRLSSHTSAGAMGLYIAESDATNNTNWVANNSPTNMDLDVYTIDQEYIFIQRVTDIRDREKYLYDLTDYTKGKAYDLTYGEEQNMYSFTGEVPTRARAEGIKEFGKRHNRPGCKTIYLFNRLGATSCEHFYGAAFSEFKYLRGVLLDREVSLREGENQIHIVKTMFRGIWR